MSIEPFSPPPRPLPALLTEVKLAAIDKLRDQIADAGHPDIREGHGWGDREYEAVRGHADHLGVTVAEYVRRTATERALGRTRSAESAESRAPHLGTLGKVAIPQVDRVRCAGGARAIEYRRAC